jgi:hypothetical protein
MSDLNDILEGEDTPAEAVEAPIEQQEVETPQGGQPRDAEGKFAPKGEESAPPAQEDKAEVGLKAALAAERQKRQEAENRYTQDVQGLRQEVEALKAPKEPEAPPPSIWEDEAGTFNHFGKQFTQTAVQQATMQSRLQTSEMLMMQEPGFTEAKQDVYQFVGENPAVNAEVLNSPHPWQAAYKAYKNHQTMQQLGTTDLTEIEAKMREKIMAEMQQQQPPQQAIPSSLADAQSARGSGQSAAAQALSLDDILKA